MEMVTQILPGLLGKFAGGGKKANKESDSSQASNKSSGDNKSSSSSKKVELTQAEAEKVANKIQTLEAFKADVEKQELAKRNALANPPVRVAPQENSPLGMA